MPKWVQEYWYKHETYTYVLLDSRERKEEIERAFPGMAEKYKTEEALKNKTWGVRLVPLEDIHLTPQLGYEAEQKGTVRLSSHWFSLLWLYWLLLGLIIST